MRPSLKMLFGRFLKLGCPAYGGPAMIGQIQQATVNHCNWIKEGDFLQGLCGVSPKKAKGEVQFICPPMQFMRRWMKGGD